MRVQVDFECYKERERERKKRKKKRKTFLGGAAELVVSGVVGVVKVRFLVGLEEHFLVGGLFFGCGEATATEALETYDE